MANQIWTYSTRSVHSMTPALSVRLWGRQSTILSRLSDTIALRPGLSTHYVLTHKALDGRHEVWSQLLNGESQAGRTRHWSRRPIASAPASLQPLGAAHRQRYALEGSRRVKING